VLILKNEKITMEIPFLLQQYKRFSQEKSLSEKAVDNKIYF